MRTIRGFGGGEEPRSDTLRCLNVSGAEPGRNSVSRLAWALALSWTPALPVVEGCSGAGVPLFLAGSSSTALDTMWESRTTPGLETGLGPRLKVSICVGSSIAVLLQGENLSHEQLYEDRNLPSLILVSISRTSRQSGLGGAARTQERGMGLNKRQHRDCPLTG